MDFHHNTSLRFILEDDSISLTFRARICSCLGKGAGRWLVAKPFILLFRIAHFIFTSLLRFCLGLIQPLPFHLPTCECGHGLDAFDTHLTCCSFGVQWIATHDVIRNVMYALAQKDGHTKWKKMVCLYIRNFITSQSLHDLKGPNLHC
jgi:hypothetical protein